MGSPETDGGDGEEQMLAWFKSPGVGKFESNAHRVTWEDLDCGFCSAVAADVAVEDVEETDQTFEFPADYGPKEVPLLRKSTQVEPEKYEADNNEEDVEV